MSTSKLKPNREDLAGYLRTIRARLSDLGPGPGTSPRVVQAFDHLTELAGARAFPRGGSGGGRSGGHADPTAQTAADDARTAEADRLLADRDLIFRKLEVAANAMSEAHDMIDLLFNPRAPIKANPGCVVCDTVRGDDHKPHPESWQPVKARERCGWHYRFRFGDGPERPGFGVDPVAELNRWHLDHLGEELRPSMVRDHMPDEFRAREERKRRPGICHHPTGKDGAPCALPFMHEGQCSPTAELQNAYN
jgi:hypothetical protein